MSGALDRSALHMLVGFVLMGGWAVFANRAHPMPAPVLAGLTQGTLTALITLGLKRMLEVASARLPGLAALVLPPLGACAMSLVLLSGVHWLAGTPEILRTLAVPTTVATLYAVAYTWRLWRARHG